MSQSRLHSALFSLSVFASGVCFAHGFVLFCLLLLVAAPSAAAQPATQPALRQTKALQEAKKVKKAGGFGDFSAW